MSNIQRRTLNIKPPQGQSLIRPFIDDVREATESIILKYGFTKFIENGEITISWYDDFPVSDGVALSIDYRTKEGEKLLGFLNHFFEKNGFNVVSVIPF